MDLEQLVFKVNTDEVATAVTKLGELGKAVNAIGKPVAALTAAQQKAALAEEKLNQERLKTAGVLAKTEAAQAKAEKATTAATRAAKEQQSVLERQVSIQEFMTQGLSKGQASVMASAQAAGALKDELKDLEGVLQNIRKLQGGDPFDSSMSALVAMKNRLDEANESIVQYANGVELTAKQARELSREKDRWVAKLQNEGKSYDEIILAIQKVEQEYIGYATKLNSLTGIEKEHERQIREQANAVRALTVAEEKADSVVNTLTGNTAHHTKTSERAAEAVARYERNLRLSGVSGEVAAKKLELYRQKVNQIQVMEEKRKVDLLSRSLAPQISDVTVSLAGGMNPMTVLLQQGLQVRDLIGQSGVEAAQLQKAFRSAATDMVSSIKGTAVALGSLLIGTIADTGKALVAFGGNLFGVSSIFEALRNRVYAMNGLMGETPKLVRAMDAAFKVLSITTGVGILAAVSAIIALVVAFKQVIQEESALSKALVLTGANLGFSKEQAIAFADSMERLGVSQSSATEFLTAIAESSASVKGNLEQLTKAATDLNTYGGVAFEDTAKIVTDLGKKPADTLVDFAIKTGLIETATLKQVIALDKAGKTTEATRIAQDAWATATQTQAKTIKESLSPIESLWLDISLAIKGAWEEFKEFARGEIIADKLRIVWQAFAVTAAEVWYVLKQTGNTLGGIAAGYVAFFSGNFERTIAIGKEMKASAELARVEHDKLIAGLMKGKSSTDSSSKSYAENSKKIKENAEAAAKLKDQLKDKKTPKSEADKLAEKVSKFADSAFRKFQVNLFEAETATGDLTDSQQYLMEVLSDPLWNNLPAVSQMKILKEAFAAINTEEEVKAEIKALEARNKTIEDFFDVADKLADIRAKEFETVNANYEATVAATDMLAFEGTLIGLVDSERQKAIKTKKIQLELDKEIARISKLTELSPDKRESLKDIAREDAALKLKNLNTEIANDMNTKMVDSVTDAIMTGLFEGGKAGSKKLRDIIEAELQKPIKVFIQAVVSDIANMAKTGDVGGGLNSIYKKGKSLFDSLSQRTGSMSKVFDKFATSSYGEKLGLSFNGGQGSELTMLGDKLSAVAGKLGDIAMGYQIGSTLNKTISNGFSAGKGMDNFQKVGTAVASYFGPVFGAIAGVVSGVFNRAFGRKLTDTGLQGSFSGDSFSGSNYKFEKGGWFRSDKTTTSAMDTGVKNALSDQFKLTKFAVEAMGVSLGQTEGFLDKFTKSIKVSFFGLTSAQIDKKLTEMFTGVAESMANMVTGLKDFKLTGETSLDALTRLSNTLVTVNGALGVLGHVLFASSIAGADAAYDLAQYFGGLDVLSSSLGSYFENFYSDAEKTAAKTTQLTDAFAKLGITLPSSIAEYRALVDAQDLSTESGKKTYASLVQLSSAFADLQTSVKEATASIEEEILRLRGLTVTESTNPLSSLQAQFSITSAMARAGDATALQQLPSLSQSLETAYLNQAGSLEDVNRMRAWIANSLSNTIGIPGFASGGVHTGGIRLVGENGPELEVTGPSRIFNAGQTSSMFDNSDLVEELVLLREEVIMLRSEVRADVVHNAKTAKLLDRVIPDGDSIKTSAL